MGLTLTAVSKDYHYDEEGEGVGEEYSSTDIGYIGYKIFRDALLNFASNGKMKDLNCRFANKELTWCYYEPKTFIVTTSKEQFDDDDKINEKIEEYFKRLEKLKEEYPDVYEIFGFIAHNDCEGEIPLFQCEMLLPVLKRFYEVDKNNYGYSGWEYNFAEDLINILEEVVEKKGKLWFS